jgi:hypothetical protein
MAVKAATRPGVPFIVAMNQGSPLVSSWAFDTADAYRLRNISVAAETLGWLRFTYDFTILRAGIRN